MNNEVKAGAAVSVSASSHKTHRRLNILFILDNNIAYAYFDYGFWGIYQMNPL